VNVPVWLSFPDTAAATRIWFFTLFFGYIIARKIQAFRRKAQAPTDIGRLGDATTFAGSVLVLVGVVHPPSLNALGDTTEFLVVAGVGGFFYAVEKLAAEGERPKVAAATSTPGPSPH